MNQRNSALIAGFSLLAIALFVAFPLGYVIPNVLVEQNAATTTQNIINQMSMFRGAIFSLLIVVILDVVAAWALYVFFKAAHEPLSLLTGWFRVLYSAIFAVAIVHFLDVTSAIDSGAVPDILNARVMSSMNAFTNTWNAALFIFGVHICLLGYLSLRSGFVPKIVSILVLLCGASYLIDYALVFLVPGYELTVSLFLGWTELVLMGWLIIWGGKSAAAVAPGQSMERS